jgi:hypothetical protein
VILALLFIVATAHFNDLKVILALLFTVATAHFHDLKVFLALLFIVTTAPHLNKLNTTILKKLKLL